MQSGQFSQSALTEAIGRMDELEKAEVISAVEHKDTMEILKPALERPESLTETETAKTAATVRVILGLYEIEVVLWDLYEQVRELLRPKPRHKQEPTRTVISPQSPMPKLAKDTATPEPQTESTHKKTPVIELLATPPPPEPTAKQKYKKPAQSEKDNDIRIYYKGVSRYPLLSREDECRIATEYKKTKDIRLKKQLINSNLRFVVGIAFGYKGYGFPILDLIQEGNEGLAIGVEKFEPERGRRLLSYAGYFVKSYIQKYIERNLRSMRGEVSIDEPSPGNNEEGVMHNILPDKESEQPQNSYGTAEARIEQKQLIKEVLEVLTEREKYIIRRRWLNGRTSGKQPTLQEIGDDMDLTRERVRQIQVRAFEKIREACSYEEASNLFTPIDNE